jgi:hypothetical protein
VFGAQAHHRIGTLLQIAGAHAQFHHGGMHVLTCLGFTSAKVYSTSIRAEGQVSQVGCKRPFLRGDPAEAGRGHEPRGDGIPFRTHLGRWRTGLTGTQTAPHHERER